MLNKVLKNRNDLIKHNVEGKSVLDLGCVQNVNADERVFWLHRFIKENCKAVTGVDLDNNEVNRLNDKGYNIICDNVETMRLNKKFEVIIAGEIIEHLSNVGLFLESAIQHLDKDGLFIITTPNAFAIRRVFRNIIFGYNANNYNHTMYYDYHTLVEVFTRYNLEPVYWSYFFDSSKPLWKYYIEKLFTLFRPVFAPNILFVLKLKEDGVDKLK